MPLCISDEPVGSVVRPGRFLERPERVIADELDCVDRRIPPGLGQEFQELMAIDCVLSAAGDIVGPDNQQPQHDSRKV
jgi:hypothetical protein